MKKYFYILTMAGCLSLINGINNAGAVQSEDVLVTYTCPAGCELHFMHSSDGRTYAHCQTPEGDTCGDPIVNIEVDTAISPVTPVVNATDLKPSKINNRVNSKKLNKTSARAAKTKPRVTPQTTNTYEPVSVVPESTIKLSSGFVNIRCPEGCRPKCTETADGTGMNCICQDANGFICNEKEVKTTNIPGLDK